MTLLSPARILSAAGVCLCLLLPAAGISQTTEPAVAVAAPEPQGAAVATPGAGGGAAETSRTVVRLTSGLAYEVVREGTGEELTTGLRAFIHYVLTDEAGKELDNSRKRLIPRPFSFVAGSGFVVAGMDQGTIGMRVGGRRILHVPPELGYGSKSQGGIPADTRLRFDVELVKIKSETPQETPQEEAPL